jgi:hypothetical protein
MKVLFLLLFIFPNLSLNAQKMDSIAVADFLELWRIGSSQMFIKMDSAYKISSRKNVNEVKISQLQFDSLVLDLTNTFKTKSFEKLSNDEHIKLIRFINTSVKLGKECKSPCQELNSLISQTGYEFKLTCKFKWTYCGGMGFHLIELEADLAGAMRTRFRIIYNAPQKLDSSVR